MSLPGSCNSEKIYIFLVKEGYTTEGACAIIANLDHESGLRPNNLQDSYNVYYGSDTYYTDIVNNKTYSKTKFMNDKAGYGLAQWTYPTRKGKLYASTVEKGISIDDLEGQLKYLISELKGMTTLDNILRTSKDLYTACDKFLITFEAPLVPDYNSRRATAKKYYDRYKNLDVNSVKNDEDFESNTNSSTVTVEKDNNSNSENIGIYTVQNGDSWWKISCKLFGTGTKMYSMAELNGKSISDIIYPGQQLKYYIDEAIIDKQTNASNSSTTSKDTEYIVKPGDGWWSIAESTLGSGTKMHILAAYNGKTIKHMLHPNDVLKIPSNSDKYDMYTVKKGDSWKLLAETKLKSVNMMNYLAEFNGKTVNQPLLAGMVLKIPRI